MFTPYTKAQRINELSRMFVSDRDGPTVNAEHRGQQRRHIYVVYVPPHAPCPWFGMSAMFRAMAAEVRWVLICTSIFQGCWGLKFVSQALDLLFGCGFLHATWVGLCLGVLNPVCQLRRVGVWPLSLYLTSRYVFVLWGGGISKPGYSALTLRHEHEPQGTHCKGFCSKEGLHYCIEGSVRSPLERDQVNCKHLSANHPRSYCSFS